MGVGEVHLPLFCYRIRYMKGYLKRYLWMDTLRSLSDKGFPRFSVRWRAGTYPEGYAAPAQASPGGMSLNVRY